MGVDGWIVSLIQSVYENAMTAVKELMEKLKRWRTGMVGKDLGKMKITKCCDGAGQNKKVCVKRVLV